MQKPCPAQSEGSQEICRVEQDQEEELKEPTLREEIEVRTAFETRQWTDDIEQAARKMAARSPKDANALLWAGAACTHASPKGQLRGRAGRICNLEDGERYLLRSIDLSGREGIARWLLIQNVAMQHGREAEAGRLLVTTVQEGSGSIEPAMLLETVQNVCTALDKRSMDKCKEAVGREVLEATKGRVPRRTVEELKITFTRPVKRTQR